MVLESIFNARPPLPIRVIRFRWDLPAYGFRDKRLKYLTNSIIPFSRKSVTGAVETLLKTRSVIGSEEQVYGLMFLEMLNTVTGLFGSFDRYFTRGPSDAGAELISELQEWTMQDLGDEARLSGAGLTTSLKGEKTLGAIESELKRLHSAELTPLEYDRLQALQDVVAYSLMKPYLPSYVQEALGRMPQVIDNAVRARLGGQFGREELGKLAGALVETQRKYGSVVKATEREIEKYSPMVLTPRRLLSITLEDLYDFPPFLIQREFDEFAIIVTELPFVWVRKQELAFIKSLKGQYPNVSGDSAEAFLMEFMTRRQVEVDDEPPPGYRAIVKPHEHHFASAESIELSRNTREDIFAVLRNPEQPKLELDVVANHGDGFSVLGESKFVTNYQNAERYYYEGSDDKEAEQERLLKLSHFLTENPGRKGEFGIPESNPVIPVFFTNAVGPLFSRQDPVVRVSILEVMMVEPFYRLLRSYLAR